MIQGKPFKTHDELIALLESRKMTVTDRDFAVRSLEYENYYSLINGYKDIFLSSTEPDVFKPGVTFYEIAALYSFDRKLREILLVDLLRIEHSIKSRIVYVFSQAHGCDHTSYLRPESFDTTIFVNFKRTNELIFNLLKLIDKRKRDNDPIKHYLSNYGYVPLWVLAQSMTFGKINSFYACMINKEKIEVAKTFGLPPSEFKAVIDYLAVFRNKCAHGDRIYCYSRDHKMSRPLPYLGYHSKLNIQRNSKGFKYGTQDLLGLLIAMKYCAHAGRYSHLIGKIDFALSTKLAPRLKSVSVHEVERIMGLVPRWKDLRTL